MCSHCPANDSSGYIHTTLHLYYKPLGILQRLTKSLNIYQFMMDCKKLHNMNLASHMSQGFSLYTKFFKQLTYLPFTMTIIYLYIQVEKIAWRKLQGYEDCSGYRRGITTLLPLSLHILFPLFGIPFLICSCHSSQMICEFLRLWYSDPLYRCNIPIYNCV